MSYDLSGSSLVFQSEIPTGAEITHPFWVFEWDLIWHEQVAFCSVVLFFAGILCSAAGIGGGGIYVAVLMVSGRLTPHNAVPLSKAIVFFGAVASFFVNMLYALRWPGATGERKNVIDVDACRLVVPATLIGTFLGVLLNRHTSDYIIVMLLTTILGLMTGMVARTARSQAIEEREEEQNVSTSVNAGAVAQTPTGEAGEGTPLLGDSDLSVMIPKSRKQVFSLKDAGMGGVLLAVVVTGGILRFHMQQCRAEVLGDASKLGACNHPVNAMFRHQMEHWMSDSKTAMVLEQLVWTLPIWACIALAAHFGTVANREVGWQARSIITYQVVAVLTGLIAGLVGVGGGLIFSPFFLLTGMEPAVAVGTSATCVLFTSSSTTIQYIFTDRIIMSLALVYGLVTCVASLVGTFLVHYIQDKYARKSYITTIVAVGVAISAMLSVVKFIYLVAGQKEDGSSKVHF